MAEVMIVAFIDLGIAKILIGFLDLDKPNLLSFILNDRTMDFAIIDESCFNHLAKLLNLIFRKSSPCFLQFKDDARAPGLFCLDWWAAIKF